MKHAKTPLTRALALRAGIPAPAAVEDTGFSDADTGDWYAEAIRYCWEHNLTAGIENNRFAPQRNLTRAQPTAVFYRIDGAPAAAKTEAFADTPLQTA